ncbi:hypothetical protein ACFV2X_43940 [Streptomyces sp. NPDC059679]|uniref:hypothetical protein n=1 Tax=Streptomyces sp. NPDC059679 TaxID=3346903 RepID=UPI0036B89A09
MCWSPAPDTAVTRCISHAEGLAVRATEEIHALVGEVRRVLRADGVFVYTVRHTGDAHYGAGRS